MGYFFNSRTSQGVNRVLQDQLAGDVINLGLFVWLQALFLPPDLCSSQSSGNLCCGRRWHLRKSGLSTDEFKLNVIL
jgi:hypothetical protein